MAKLAGQFEPGDGFFSATGRAEEYLETIELGGLVVFDPDDPEVQKRVEKVINDEGGQPGSSIHGWRCSYPDSYGECGCVAEIARSVLSALTVKPWPKDRLWADVVEENDQ